MTSDEALMLEFQGGSRAALEELFARYRTPLYGFFRRRLNDPERAEDLVQETFLAVIRAASRCNDLRAPNLDMQSNRFAENQSVKGSWATPSIACPIHDPSTIDFERIECPAGGERFVLGAGSLPSVG